jgi:hypothetical protein
MTYGGYQRRQPIEWQGGLALVGSCFWLESESELESDET